jgi:hypothetical protein
MVPVGVPFVAVVLVVAAVTIAITDPPSLMAIDVSLRVFRLLPASVTVLIALDADTVIAVGITTLVVRASATLANTDGTARHNAAITTEFEP